MMEVNVVPSVVLHFHGFRSSLLSNLWDACRRIGLDMAQRSLQFTLICVAMYYLKLLLAAALLKLMHSWVVYATFLACEALALKHGKKERTFLLGGAVAPTIAAPLTAAPLAKVVVVADAAPTLPRLALSASIAVLPEAGAAALSQLKDDGDQFSSKAQLSTTTSTATTTAALLATPQQPRQLSAVRRRLVAQLRAPFPGVNAVPHERRRRADVSLCDAKIRVGKAFLDPIAATATTDEDKKKRNRIDTYMMRVDSSKPDDKHMNPVVMWDVTATFEEFCKLEKNLRAEVKAKRLRNVAVPHLASGAILFVQPELTQDVLGKRRMRLQTFVDAVRADRVLGDSDAMRKFFQAF